MEEKTDQHNENSFFYFLRLLISNWKLLLGLYFSVGIITVIVLLVIPKWYKSETTVVILDDSSSSSLTNLVSEFSSLGLGLGSGTSVETYTEYLNTRKMYDRLINEFNLLEVYQVELREDAYEQIFNNMGVGDNENDTFTISYLYKENPQKAKEIVEFLYHELERIALEVDQAEASNFREYIEKYYLQTNTKLRNDEDSLAAFQTKTGILDLETQVEVTLQGIAELELQKVKLEIEKNYLERSFESSSRTNELTNQINSITEKISDLAKKQSITLVSIEHVPAKGADFLRLRRDITIGSKVSEYLRLQYEQALLDEQKISSNLYMVDPPQVSQKKYKPQRTRLLMIVMFFTGVLSLVYIRAQDYYLENSDQIKALFKKQ